MLVELLKLLLGRALLKVVAVRWLLGADVKLFKFSCDYFLVLLFSLLAGTPMRPSPLLAPFVDAN